MKHSNTIVWIDDDPDRAHTAEDIGAQFVNVERKDLSEAVSTLLKGTQPRLIILDHILDKTATKNPMFRRGSTIAEAIKEHWPSCPVVGVTNVDKARQIDIRTRRAYDDLFEFMDFGSYRDRIESISEGFALVAKRRPKKVRELVSLLNPPHEEVDRLVDALPEQLKARLQDRSLPSQVSRWVDHLMERAGFLYDALWSATFVGLNEDGFQVVAEHFDAAKYSGVFARADQRRWWSASLSHLLYKQCKPDRGELSWHVGRRLPGITDEHFSVCYYCREAFPEIVGFLDTASSEQQRAAMHLKCTVLHPLYKRELFFEDIRVMRGK